MIDISKLTTACSSENSVKGSVVALLNGLADSILEQRTDVNPDPVTLATLERLALQIKENLKHLADAVAENTSASAEEWATEETPEHPPPLEYTAAVEPDEDTDSAPDDDDDKPYRGRRKR